MQHKKMCFLYEGETTNIIFHSLRGYIGKKCNFKFFYILNRENNFVYIFLNMKERIFY